MHIRWLAFVFLLFPFCFLKEVYSHGYLHDPPQRSSLWRHGFNAPKNFNDNGLNCGGVEYQWTIYNGRCGVCGDPWGGERLHEDGGTYARGIIGRKYSSGSVIDTVVNITAWHRGWFEYKLCSQDNPYIPVSQECLDKYPLLLANGSERFYPHKQGVYHIKIKLPDGVSCSQCVLQWTYKTTNSWGCNEKGQCGLGYGPSEEFINCADIQIDTANDIDTNVPVDKVLSVLSNPNWANTENDTSTKSNEKEDVTDDDNSIQQITTTFTNVRNNPICYAKGPYRAVPGMNEWCYQMCLTTPPCPISHCECNQ